MSQTISPNAGILYGLKRVCTAWDVSRSTYYSRQKRLVSAKQNVLEKRGTKPMISDSELLDLIKTDIISSPFKGEGHRKVHARLRRQKVEVGRNRILRIMKENNLLSPHRGIQASKDPYDGTIITDKPNVMWCSDGTKIFTVDDGWVFSSSIMQNGYSPS